MGWFWARLDIIRPVEDKGGSFLPRLPSLNSTTKRAPSVATTFLFSSPFGVSIYALLPTYFRLPSFITSPPPRRKASILDGWSIILKFKWQSSICSLLKLKGLVENFVQTKIDKTRFFTVHYAHSAFHIYWTHSITWNYIKSFIRGNYLKKRKVIKVQSGKILFHWEEMWQIACVYVFLETWNTI